MERANAPEVAALLAQINDGRVPVEVKNAAGPTNLNSIWYSPGFTARRLAILDGADNDGIDEAAVPMIRNRAGRILVQGRNAAGNQTAKTTGSHRIRKQIQAMQDELKLYVERFGSRCFGRPSIFTDRFEV